MGPKMERMEVFIDLFYGPGEILAPLLYCAFKQKDLFPVQNIRDKIGFNFFSKAWMQAKSMKWNKLTQSIDQFYFSERAEIKGKEKRGVKWG